MTMFDTSSLGVPDAGLFDREAERSHTLPAEWYYDDAVFKAEREAIFFKSWIYQCHESDLPEPGDYTAGAVTDQGVILIRGEDGAIRGFYNVCSHRAHPLLAGQGRTKLIVCPYHQWTYATDGTFRGARGRETLSDWCPENADLKPVRVETIGGLIFVNLDQAAIPLAEQIGRFEADMRECCPRLDELVKVERYERQVAANWKTVIDNNHECYHCAVNHKSLMELVDYRDKAVWSDDGITFSHRVEKKTLDNGAYRVDGSNLEQESLFGYIWPTLIPLFFPGSASLALFQVVPAEAAVNDVEIAHRSPA